MRHISSYLEKVPFHKKAVFQLPQANVSLRKMKKSFKHPKASGSKH